MYINNYILRYTWIYRYIQNVYEKVYRKEWKYILITGLDLGNHNVKTPEINPKTNKAVLFPAKICKDQRLMQLRKPNDDNLVNFENLKCLVGEGSFQTETNKLDKELYKICFLSALARSTSSACEEFKVVTGLPANQFTQKNKDRIRNEILPDKVYSIEVAGEKKSIILNTVEFFPESAAPYYGMTLDQKNQVKFSDLIIVNMGGGNTNVAYFKFTKGKTVLSKSSTVMSGSLNLYSDFINAINGEFSLNKVLEDAEDTLVYGLQIYGEKQNLAFTQDIINTHIDKIFEELNLYPIKSSKVMFTGGACKALKPVLQARIKNCIFQTNYLTATAEGFKRVGEMLWPRF